MINRIIENEAELTAVLKECQRVFVLFYASWCPHSRRFLPIFDKYALDNDPQFCRVMTDQVRECEDTYDIEVVPTVIFFEKGRAIKRIEGVLGSGLTEGQLDDLIKSCDLTDGEAGKPGKIKS